jgi:hypothetical protein
MVADDDGERREPLTSATILGESGSEEIRKAFQPRRQMTRFSVRVTFAINPFPVVKMDAILEAKNCGEWLDALDERCHMSSLELEKSP